MCQSMTILSGLLMTSNFVLVLVISCEKEPHCSVPAVIHLFAPDPCPATPKYLEIEYACVGRLSHAALRVFYAWLDFVFTILIYSI